MQGAEAGRAGRHPSPAPHSPGWAAAPRQIRLSPSAPAAPGRLLLRTLRDPPRQALCAGEGTGAQAWPRGRGRGPPRGRQSRCWRRPRSRSRSLIQSFLQKMRGTGDLVADVDCPLIFHDKTILVAVSVYVGDVLRYYQLHPLQSYPKTRLRKDTTVGLQMVSFDLQTQLCIWCCGLLGYHVYNVWIQSVFQNQS